jgi:hypothetical protein
LKRPGFVILVFWQLDERNVVGPDASTLGGTGASIRDEDWAAGLLAARASGLREFSAYIDRPPEACAEVLVMAVKGLRGVAEDAGGAPLSGADGKALASAFAALGWVQDAWCGLVLSPAEGPFLAGERLALCVELIDPRTIVALDDAARTAFEAAWGVLLPSAASGPQTATDARGRLFVSVDGFESALASERRKQLVWAQLKQLANGKHAKPLPEG